MKDKKKGPGKAKQQEPENSKQALKLILNKKPITVRASGFSKAFKSLASKQFNEGITDRKATVKAGDITIEEGKVIVLPAYQAIPLLRNNIVQAVRFGR